MFQPGHKIKNKSRIYTARIQKKTNKPKNNFYFGNLIGRGKHLAKNYDIANIL